MQLNKAHKFSFQKENAFENAEMNFSHFYNFIIFMHCYHPFIIEQIKYKIKYKKNVFLTTTNTYKRNRGSKLSVESI